MTDYGKTTSETAIHKKPNTSTLKINNQTYIYTMISLNKLHHIAILCSDHEKSKHFCKAISGSTIL